MCQPTLCARTTTLVLIAIGCCLMAGCQTARYTGAEPSARSFYEDPDIHQTYIGFDLNFTLEDPPSHVPTWAPHRDALP